MSARSRARGVDPVRLEVARGVFVGLCEEMGDSLMRTGASPNIKERRDYSCALFDRRGRTVAQGDHMPVHLGSMPASVAAALESVPLGPGDVALLNDPFRGGTHLPDLTVVAPVRLRGSRPAFYLANRAHHSDVGGMSPGSMPLGTEIHQEGLVIPPVRFVRGGHVDEGILALILANSRTPAERDADLRAQLSALTAGERRLREWAARWGARELAGCAGALQTAGRRAMERMLTGLPRGRFSAEERLEDDGFGAGPITLRVELTLGGPRAVVDLRGSDDQVRGGINAVAAITRSAVHYVFRCLLAERSDAAAAAGETPWNAGSWEPIRILTRPGSVLDARPPAAVAGGNVETSQRVVDLLLSALARALPGEIPADSQGTMNNLAFGGEHPLTGKPFAYYETLAGGGGARRGAAGVSGRHSHMTNSLNTPIEALESAYPLEVVRTTLRRGSGGAGRWRGGDGITRALRFGTAVRVSLLTERRLAGPAGRDGGGPGAAGRNGVIAAGARGAGAGRTRAVPSKANLVLAAGDVLVIETPGGGGWGRPQRRR